MVGTGWAAAPITGRLEPPTGCLQALASPDSHPLLLVVLSSRMVYSVTEWPRMRSVALDEGFAVVTWRSPAESEEEWQAAVRVAGWPDAEAGQVRPVPPACAAWLGRPNHFPFSRIFEGGRVHPWPIWGVLSDRAWQASLRCRRDALIRQSQGCGP